MRVAVSACLLGAPVRYDGGAKPCPEVLELAEKVEVVRVCPETASGLPVPRPPAEQRDGRVFLSDGRDVTAEFARGADLSLAAVRRSPVSLAVLKAKSPSCGVGLVYDGTYTGRLVAGQGVFAERLAREGICVVTEDTVRECKPSVEHPVAIVLGSGLGHLGSLVRPVRRIDYRDIDGFPVTARPVPGHSFEATVGTIDDVPVVVYPGRIQGNAGVGLGILTDQINLTGRNPLAEWDGLRDVESPFVDMNDAFSPYLRSIARGVADDLGIHVEEGVYAGVLGPCFETPAEVAALRTLGVSYVGMSTVCEVVMARARSACPMWA